MSSLPNDRILLIYNADEGWISKLQDAVHKTLSPESYPCSLCMISYSPVAMKRRWRSFLNDLPQDKEFFHRQDFARAFPKLANMPLPAILLEHNGQVVTILDDEQLDGLEDLDALIAACKEALGDTENQLDRVTPAFSSSG